MKTKNQRFFDSEKSKHFLKNKVKKQILISVVAMIVLLAGLSAVSAMQPEVVVSGFKITSGSLAVGKDFTLSLTLMNIEPAACAQAITTTLQASYPFIMKGVATLPAGDLCSGNADAHATVDFPLKIDPTAKGGSYQITVTNNYQTPTLIQFSNTNVLNLFVEGAPELNSYIISSSPVDIYPGDTATLTAVVVNDGSFQAQSVTALMSAGANSPIEVSPANSFSSFGLIDAKQSKTATFTVEVPKNAPAKDYPISLEVQYLDENLESQATNFPLTLHVKPKAIFETADAGSDSLFPNQNSRAVKLLLKNTGTDTAYKLRLKVMPQYPFSTDGSVRYIDVLEPGKTAAVQFTVDTDKDATPGTYSLDVLVGFEDSQGKKLQDTTNLSLEIKSTTFFMAVFLNYWFLWLIAVIAIVVIVRRRKKKATGQKKA